MASLYWNSDIRVLSEATTSIGELKRVIEHELQRNRFADVRRNNLEVAGGRSGVWLSVAHFHIADRRFYEVVIASGDSFDATKNTVLEVVGKLRGLRFL